MDSLSTRLKDLKPNIEEICSTSGIAGVSLGVLQGETTYRQNFGFRNIQKRLPTTSDTIYQIASMTKAFTGAAITSLVNDGRLQLDTPISEILPNFRHNDPTVHKLVTIADLLAHRHGIQRADRLWLGCEGKLLCAKNQTVPIFNNLKSVKPFRSVWMYNNWGYSVAGEIIESITGQSFPQYIQRTITGPLGMDQTVLDKSWGLKDDVADAYSALDNTELYQVPLPDLHGGSLMGPAGGLMSSVNDLLKFYKAILEQNRADFEGHNTAHRLATSLADIRATFSPHQFMDEKSPREKSYGLGWVRSQLPGKIGDIGENLALMGEDMPLLAQGVDPILAIWHQGSLVGFTSFVMLFPKIETAIVVLTNSMALNDGADWIGQLLVEEVLEAPVRNNFVDLAQESSRRALERYEMMLKTLNDNQRPGTHPRQLHKYTGTYVTESKLHRVTVTEEFDTLAIAFQGLLSQKYELRHYHEDIFSWSMAFNEQVKRARSIVRNPDFYLICFSFDQQGQCQKLNWVCDRDLPQGLDFLKEEG